MQSIFRPAARRETLGEQSEGGRRDGGLKMGWTKPLPSAWPMGIDCLPDLGRGSDVARSDECVGCFVGPRCLQWSMTVSGEWDLCLRFSPGWPVWQRCSCRLARPSLPEAIWSASH